MADETFNEIFSKRLRFYLSKYNMTQVELAKKLGVGTTTVYNWCNGIKSPRMDKVDAMCNLFSCSRADLVDEKSSTPETPILSSSEKKLLFDFSKLNEKGQLKVLEDTHNLTLLSAYTEGFREPEPDYMMPKAAHERTDIDVTEEMRKHDDDIMENF